MPKKFQHEWGFMANSKNGDLLYCGLCNQWKIGDSKPFKMSYITYIKMYLNDKIDASECLGSKENARKMLNNK